MELEERLGSFQTEVPRLVPRKYIYDATVEVYEANNPPDGASERMFEWCIQVIDVDENEGYVSSEKLPGIISRAREFVGWLYD